MSISKTTVAAAIQAAIDANATNDATIFALGTSVASVALESTIFPDGYPSGYDHDDFWQWHDAKGTFLWVAEGIANIINDNIVSGSDTQVGYFDASGRVIGSANLTYANGHLILANDKSLKWKNTADTIDASVKLDSSDQLHIEAGVGGVINFYNNNASSLMAKMALGKTAFYSVPAHANNAAAIAGGLAAGDIYRSGGDPDVLYIVH